MQSILPSSIPSSSVFVFPDEDDDSPLRALEASYKDPESARTTSCRSREEAHRESQTLYIHKGGHPLLHAECGGGHLGTRSPRARIGGHQKRGPLGRSQVSGHDRAHSARAIEWQVDSSFRVGVRVRICQRAEPDDNAGPVVFFASDVLGGQVPLDDGLPLNQAAMMSIMFSNTGPPSGERLVSSVCYIRGELIRTQRTLLQIRLKGNIIDHSRLCIDQYRDPSNPLRTRILPCMHCTSLDDDVAWVLNQSL